MTQKNPEKKARLAVKARQTKWAPIWVVLKAFGVGKKIHPSMVTRHRRSWKRTKIHMKPRKARKSHFG
jgi:ribosomal protein L39E